MTHERRDLGPGLLILDGATGTELASRGVEVPLPIWSAAALLEAPDVVEQIHADYLEAGAGAIVTNTFRTHRRSLAKVGMGDRARELTTLAVDIARSARDRVNPGALVLGSVSPLEDCFRPDLSPGMEASRAEHAEMITHLLDAGVDFVLIETMGTRHESLAAAEMARHLTGKRWMICFCTKTVGPPGVMIHGAPLVDVLDAVQDACAVGVNCIEAPAVTPQVALLRRLLPERVRVAAYGNIGHADEDGRWVGGAAIPPERFAAYAAEWVDAGATIVGGCCGTTPESIRSVAERLRGGAPPAASASTS